MGKKCLNSFAQSTDKDRPEEFTNKMKRSVLILIILLFSFQLEAFAVVKDLSADDASVIVQKMNDAGIISSYDAQIALNDLSENKNESIPSSVKSILKENPEMAIKIYKQKMKRNSNSRIPASIDRLE